VSKALTVVLADDEPLARSILRRLLQTDPELSLVAECAHGKAAVDAVREHRPDLLLLDVQMPGLDGFGVLSELDPEQVPAVVFVTAHDDYALAAFEVEAVDYLLKPFDDERFAKAMTRAKAKARDTDPENGVRLKRLAVRHQGRIDLVELQQVRWIEAADQYVRLHTFEGNHLLRESMSHLEEQLDPAVFLRVHRSAIVAVRCLRTLQASGRGTGTVQLDDGTELPVARSRMAEVRAKLGGG